MTLYSLHTPPPLVDPVMVFGLAGWGDGASAASDAADWLADGGQPIVTFDPDSIFDYRSNRPILRFSPGQPHTVTWPRMEIVHVKPAGRDVLVLVGNEPDFRWEAICDALVDLAQRFGVSHVVTVGAVSTPIRHAAAPPVFCTASDSRLLQGGDELLLDEIVVPSSAGTVFRSALQDVGIEAIGYWVQVPQYVARPYHAGIVALLRKVSAQLGASFDLGDLESNSRVQLERLDEIIAKRSDASDFVEGLGSSVGTTSKMPDEMPSADEIAAEVTEFLQNPDNSGT